MGLLSSTFAESGSGAGPIAVCTRLGSQGLDSSVVAMGAELLRRGVASA